MKYCFRSDKQSSQGCVFGNTKKSVILQCEQHLRVHPNFLNNNILHKLPFIKDILRHRSLSIVGLDKNTGKTVCLNYILRRLHQESVQCAVTSIGVDGEQVDSVYGSAKPEITLYEGMQFITSERHYRQRQLVSKILAVDQRSTSLGRLVTGEVLCGGRILLSGAATTACLREQINDFKQKGTQLTIIDGALSRLSLASPTVTDAMVLATGAVVSPNINQLINKTRYVCKLISIEETSPELQQMLLPLERGLWSVDDGKLHDLQISSVFMLDSGIDILSHGKTIFAAGAVSDRLIKYLSRQKEVADVILIIRDFTKLFVAPEVLNEYLRRGGQIRVLQRSNLVAVCLNPTSPHGYNLHSQEACQALSEALHLPVYDVVQVEKQQKLLS